MIILITDDDDCIGYLNDWDKRIPNLDVVDDYRNEKKEIQALQGKQFPFSFGDYVVKILMGGVDSWFDDLDEKKVTIDGYGQPIADSSSLWWLLSWLLNFFWPTNQNL
ncbi:unnamed protein product [Rotaria sp. Silwood2]|nr:unnamed protein product [Rotaria sp. Silwood2]CAF2923882.1 unnamed protein product [Rotaria sp. Silwood2]CAF3002413.1 unnamed protein product [Rotaria sp. Silwood2]CAF3327073.1 unnamed protein product [Rotaria sp. Silwood2]CAF4127955.1 unnamed protein product [Rotaria sp. Silwood2]